MSEKGVLDDHNSLCPSWREERGEGVMGGMQYAWTFEFFVSFEFLMLSVVRVTASCACGLGL